MDDVICNPDTDDTLLDCSYRDETNEDCESTEGAGVECFYYGSWGTWSSWSSCSSTCGGWTWRTRECYPLGSECLGSGGEIKNCNTETCPDGPSSEGKTSLVKGQNWKCSISGILIVGGSAEVFNPDTGVTCFVGDMPEPTDYSSVCHGLVCGGVGAGDIYERYISFSELQ